MPRDFKGGATFSSSAATRLFLSEGFFRWSRDVCLRRRCFAPSMVVAQGFAQRRRHALVVGGVGILQDREIGANALEAMGRGA
jgi:hypothetical protein